MDSLRSPAWGKGGGTVAARDLLPIPLSWNPAAVAPSALQPDRGSAAGWCAGSQALEMPRDASALSPTDPGAPLETGPFLGQPAWGLLLLWGLLFSSCVRQRPHLIPQLGPEQALTSDR